MYVYMRTADRWMLQHLQVDNLQLLQQLKNVVRMWLVLLLILILTLNSDVVAVTGSEAKAVTVVA